MKYLIAALAVCALGTATAQASNESFTLNEARSAALTAYSTDGWQAFDAAVLPCTWLGPRHHHAECQVITGPLNIGQYFTVTSWTWIADVTRSGSCPLGANQHSDVGFHNCFTGPLVASAATTPSPL